MTQYKVIAGACPCPHQRVILHSGNIVDADFFTEGQAEKLVEDGFIETISEIKEDPKKTEPKNKK